MLADGGYIRQNFADEIKRISAAEVVKRSELHTFAVLSKRWILEHPFGWLDKLPQAFEKLRETTTKVLSDGLSCFHSYYSYKILNRL